MKRQPSTTLTLALTTILFISAAGAQQTELQSNDLPSISESDVAYPYRLIPTRNIWTHILLDTSTGRAWQVQYSLDETPGGRVPLNEHSLLPDGATPKNGRFAAYPTKNMFTFLLMDREDSRIWQLQWSNEPESRGIVAPIPSTK